MSNSIIVQPKGFCQLSSSDSDLENLDFRLSKLTKKTVSKKLKENIDNPIKKKILSKKKKIKKDLSIKKDEKLKTRTPNRSKLISIFDSDEDKENNIIDELCIVPESQSFSTSPVIPASQNVSHVSVTTIPDSQDTLSCLLKDISPVRNSCDKLHTSYSDDKTLKAGKLRNVLKGIQLQKDEDEKLINGGNENSCRNHLSPLICNSGNAEGCVNNSTPVTKSPTRKNRLSTKKNKSKEKKLDLPAEADMLAPICKNVKSRRKKRYVSQRNQSHLFSNFSSGSDDDQNLLLSQDKNSFLKATRLNDASGIDISKLSAHGISICDSHDEDPDLKDADSKLLSLLSESQNKSKVRKSSKRRGKKSDESFNSTSSSCGISETSKLSTDDFTQRCVERSKKIGFDQKQKSESKPPRITRRKQKNVTAVTQNVTVVTPSAPNASTKPQLEPVDVSPVNISGSPETVIKDTDNRPISKAEQSILVQNQSLQVSFPSPTGIENFDVSGMLQNHQNSTKSSSSGSANNCSFTSATNDHEDSISKLNLSDTFVPTFEKRKKERMSVYFDAVDSNILPTFEARKNERRSIYFDAVDYISENEEDDKIEFVKNDENQKRKIENRRSFFCAVQDMSMQANFSSSEEEDHQEQKQEPEEEFELKAPVNNPVRRENRKSFYCDVQDTSLQANFDSSESDDEMSAKPEENGENSTRSTKIENRKSFYCNVQDTSLQANFDSSLSESDSNQSPKSNEVNVNVDKKLAIADFAAESESDVDDEEHNVSMQGCDVMNLSKRKHEENLEIIEEIDLEENKNTTSFERESGSIPHCAKQSIVNDSPAKYEIIPQWTDEENDKSKLSSDESIESPQVILKVRSPGKEINKTIVDYEIMPEPSVESMISPIESVVSPTRSMPRRPSTGFSNRTTDSINDNMSYTSNDSSLYQQNGSYVNLLNDKERRNMGSVGSESSVGSYMYVTALDNNLTSTKQRTSSSVTSPYWKQEITSAKKRYYLFNNKIGKKNSLFKSLNAQLALDWNSLRLNVVSLRLCSSLKCYLTNTYSNIIMMINNLFLQFNYNTFCLFYRAQKMIVLSSESEEEELEKCKCYIFVSLVCVKTLNIFSFLSYMFYYLCFCTKHIY